MAVLDFLHYKPHIDKRDEKFYVFSNYAYLFCVFAHLIFLVLGYLLKVYILAVFNIYSVIIFPVCLILNRKNRLKLAFYLAITELILHAFVATLCIGFEGCFFLAFIGVCVVIAYSPFVSFVNKVVLLPLMLMVFLASYLITANYGAMYTIDALFVQSFGVLNIIVITVSIIYVLMMYFDLTNTLNEKLKRSSEIDPLTQTYNRRFLNEYLEIEVKRQLEQIKYNLNFEGVHDFTLALIDIDDFKEINDTYGHLAGDLVLQETASLIKGSLFERDVLCRYGGEEFIIVFIKTVKNNTITVAEKIRKLVNEHEFKLSDTVRKKLSISIGLASFGELPGGKAMDIINLADKRLYAAKHQGKNRVVYN